MSIFGASDFNSPADDFVEYERSVVRGHAAKVRDFLAKGFKADAQRFGSPFLLSAVVEGQTEVVQILLEHGADPNSGNLQGWNSMHQAFRMKNHEMIEMMLSHDVNFSIKDQRSHTPLRVAVDAGDVTALALLEGKGIELCVESADDDGMTPLQVAVQHRNIDIVKWLIANGSDVHYREPAGRNAADFAQDWVEGRRALEAAELTSVDARQSMREALARAPSAEPSQTEEEGLPAAPAVSVIRKRSIG
jgi:ankyrin repeat protein